METRALLIGERGDLDGERKVFDFVRGQLLDRGEADENAQCAIVFSSIGDRVEMGADHQQRHVFGMEGAAEKIAPVIGGDDEACGAHPFTEARRGSLHAATAEDACEFTAFVADLAKRLQAIPCEHLVQLPR